MNDHPHFCDCERCITGIPAKQTVVTFDRAKRKMRSWEDHEERKRATQAALYQRRKLSGAR